SSPVFGAELLLARAQFEIDAAARHLGHAARLLARDVPRGHAVIAGAHSVEDELPFAVAAGEAPEIGQYDPRVGDRVAVRVVHDAAEALELLHQAPWPVGEVHAHRLRPHVGAAREAQAGLDLELDRIVDRRLVAAADRSPESGLLPLLAGPLRPDRAHLAE